MKYWLVKSDPEEYGWDQLVKDKSTAWTGVRNFAARLHLKGMQKGDPVLFYHSGGIKEVVGIAEVAKTHYTDPTATEGEWYCVDLKARTVLPKVVSLDAIKKVPELKDIPLIRISRLSVMPLEQAAFEKILNMGGGKL